MHIFLGKGKFNISTNRKRWPREWQEKPTNLVVPLTVQKKKKRKRKKRNQNKKKDEANSNPCQEDEEYSIIRNEKEEDNFC